MSSLWERFLSEENFYRAWRAVRSNIPRARRRIPGPDGVSLAHFERHLPSLLGQLRRELAQGTYRPSRVRQVRIPKADGSTRTLTILSVRDRVAQRAAFQVLVPIWEPVFLSVSFGFRPGRSPHSAVAYLKQQRTPERGWVLNSDIARCFESIHHKLLLEMLAKRVKEPRMLRLIQLWLEAGTVPSLSVKPSFSPRFSRWKALRARAAALFQDIMKETLWHWGIPLDDEDGPGLPWETPDPLSSSWRTWTRHSLVLLAGWLFPRARRWWKARKAAWPHHRTRFEPEHVWAVLLLLVVMGWAITLTTRLYARDDMGLLQGSPLSPLMANVYLHPLMWQWCGKAGPWCALPMIGWYAPRMCAASDRPGRTHARFWRGCTSRYSPRKPGGFHRIRALPGWAFRFRPWPSGRPRRDSRRPSRFLRRSAMRWYERFFLFLLWWILYRRLMALLHQWLDA